MPFLDEVVVESAQQWHRKSAVGLRQLARQDAGIWGRRGPVRFMVLDTFGYADPLVADGDYFAAPAQDRMIDTVDPTDLASVPPFMWGILASYGDYTMPALLHDTLCEAAAKAGGGAGRRLRREADGLFRRMLKCEANVGIGTRWMMWAAVRLFASKVVGAAALLMALFGAAVAWSAANARIEGWGFFPVSPWWGIGLAVSSAALLVVAAVAGREDIGYQPSAVVGIMGAGLIAVPAVALLWPVVVVTVVSASAMRALDGVLFIGHAAFVRFPLWVWDQLPWVGPAPAGGGVGASPEAKKRTLRHEPVPVQVALRRV
jgi:Protein of unknown function (DUF1353)